MWTGPEPALEVRSSIERKVQIVDSQSVEPAMGVPFPLYDVIVNSPGDVHMQGSSRRMSPNRGERALLGKVVLVQAWHLPRSLPWRWQRGKGKQQVEFQELRTWTVIRFPE